MASILTLQKRRDDALAAFASAAGPAARATALAKLEAAADDLATFKAGLAAKNKSYVKKEERYEEEDSAEEESESASEEESGGGKEKAKPLMEKKAKERGDESESSASESSASASESSTESSESEPPSESEDESTGSSSTESSATASAEEEEEERAQAAAELGNAQGLFSHARLFRLAQQVTGKRDVQEVFGALDGLGLRLKAAEALEGRIAALEGDKRTARVDTMLTAAMRAGKVTKQMLPALRATGKRSVAELKGLLDVMPARVRTAEAGPLEGRSDAAAEHDAHAPSAGAGKGRKLLEAQNLTAEERAVIDELREGTGKDFDTFFAEMNERIKLAGQRRRTNGAA